MNAKTENERNTNINAFLFAFICGYSRSFALNYFAYISGYIYSAESI